MKQIFIQDNWPHTWKYSYHYDLLEIYGDRSHKGYAYAYANRQKCTLDLVQKAAPSGAKVLDVAAAQGNFSLMLAELGYEVTWNDIRSDLIDYVKLKHEHGVINFLPGNLFELEIEDYFDVVLVTEIIEHVAHPDQFLKRISTLIKPGGAIVMTTPNGNYFKNKLPKFSECKDFSQLEKKQFGPDGEDHIFLLHLEEVYELASICNFSIEEIKLITNPLTNGHLKSEVLLNILPYKLVSLLEQYSCSLPLGLRKKFHTGIAVLFRRLG